MIDRRETSNPEESSVAETMRKAALKALDLSEGLSKKTLGGGITGSYIGSSFGPFGALIGMAAGAVVTNVVAELAERDKRIFIRNQSR